MVFYRLPFEPYAPVRRQMLNLLRAVNRVRRQAGFKPVPAGNSVFFTRVLRALEARTWPEDLFPSRVSFLRLFSSKGF